MTSSFSRDPRGAAATTKTFGSYRIAMELGADALATTYLACRTSPEGQSQQVRLAVMHAQLAESEAHVQRFLDEARLAAALTHETVGAVLDAGRAEGCPYAAYGYVGGRTLAEVLAVLRTQPAYSARVPAFACHLLAKACAGLHLVHQGLAQSGLEGTALPSGLSPHSLLVTYDGSVRIAGFGGRTWGSPGAPPGASLLEADYPYRAPERILNHEADRRADLWSIGVMLFEAVTGLQPFLRTTRLAIDRAIVSDALPTLKLTDFVLLGEIVDSCLKRRASDRFEDATQLAESIQQYLTQMQNNTVEAELAQAMQQLFGDVAEQERSWLRTMSIAEASAYLYSHHGRGQDVALGGAPAAAAPPIEPSSADLWSRPAPSAVTAPAQPPAPMPEEKADDDEVVTPKRRAIWPVVALLGTLGVFGALLRSLAPPSESEPTAVQVVEPAPTPSPTPPPSVPEPTHEVAPSAVAPIATPEPAPRVEPTPEPVPVEPEKVEPVVPAVEPAPEPKPERPKRKKAEREPPAEREPANAKEPAPAREPAAQAAAPAAKPAKPGRKNQARGEPGTVVIGASDGWAEVYFDGTRLGATPIRTELPSGTLTLEFRAFGTGTPHTMSVVVKAGEVTKVRVPL